MHSPNRAIIVLTVSLVIAIAVACNCPCHRVAFVPRQRWSARPSTSTDYQLRPVRYVIVHHTATVTCSTKSKCSRIISRIQAFHMERMDYDDIGYKCVVVSYYSIRNHIDRNIQLVERHFPSSFLIGNDGRIYEGVGWHIVGAHTYRYNRNGLGIAFIGDFNGTKHVDTLAAETDIGITYFLSAQIDQTSCPPKPP